MTRPEPILLVLLFQDKSFTRDLGPALWASLREVQNFYHLGWADRTFRAIFLAAEVSDAIRAETPLDWEEVQSILAGQDFWAAARGRRSRTYSQDILAKSTRELLIRLATPDSGSARSPFLKWLRPGRAMKASRIEKLPMVLVTDREITPPINWRYIIWDDVPEGSVVSVAPTDPNYWHEKDEARAATVKHRIRTACIQIVGEILGLDTCSNPTCFLYDNVPSVTTLDEMIALGPEHDVESLALRGFEARPDRPEEIQPVVLNPVREGGFASDA